MKKKEEDNKPIECLTCGKKETRMVRVLEIEDPYGNRHKVDTRNIVHVCTNEQCCLRINPVKVKTWKIIN